MGLGILAAEATKHLDLVGKLRGYFIVVFAVGLFCGSIYMLLATNLGARLGFLVAFASLSGFLMLLGLIWFTNLTPLNANRPWPRPRRPVTSKRPGSRSTRPPRGRSRPPSTPSSPPKATGSSSTATPPTTWS